MGRQDAKNRDKAVWSGAENAITLATRKSRVERA